jgi:hypothetical protein
LFYQLLFFYCVVALFSTCSGSTMTCSWLSLLEVMKIT